MKPKLIRRICDPVLKNLLLSEGVPSLAAQVLASRPLPVNNTSCLSVFSPKLAALDSPFLLKDMDVAVERLMLAIKRKEIIGLETDHDCDGQTSHAVLFESLTSILGVRDHNIQSYIGHRMEEGYGLSEKLCERILNAHPRPSLIITADNGSSDEARIARLKAEGIDVIVTDHHQLPVEGPPKSALACINPTRDDCTFPDSLIAGCMVAWLFMAAVRNKMIESHMLAPTVPSMSQVLDFVAVGTVADCVSLARSINNRAVVQFGLKLIQKMQRPCWQALAPLLGEREVCSQDLGFLIGPMLNSDGRLGDAFQSVNFLLSKERTEAEPWAESLWQANNERKAIQKVITDKALLEAATLVEKGWQSLVIYLKEDGHAGIHGISASRIKDRFGRPTILFSPKLNEPGVITGSARSIDGLNMREALQQVAEREPSLLIGFGGHSGAAGLALFEQNLLTFQLAFENVIKEMIGRDKIEIGPVIYSDGELEPYEITLESVQVLRQLEPFGREFDYPQFEVKARVVSQRIIGQDQTHLKLNLEIAPRQWVEAIWFQAMDEEGLMPVQVGEAYRFLVQLQENNFRGQVRLQLQVIALLT